MPSSKVGTGEVGAGGGGGTTSQSWGDQNRSLIEDVEKFNQGLD